MNNRTREYHRLVSKEMQAWNNYLREIPRRRQKHWFSVYTRLRKKIDGIWIWNSETQAHELIQKK